jgi:hypothetical protein
MSPVSFTYLPCCYFQYPGYMCHLCNSVIIYIHIYIYIYILISIYWQQMMRRSLQGGRHVWWGVGAWWLRGKPTWLLIWQVFLVHTFETRPAFWVMGKWTVCCIVLWPCDHILDRSACDCKMSNRDIGKLFTVKHGT